MTQHCALLLLFTVIGACQVGAEPTTIRLRFVWGSGPQSPQKWFGKISAQGAAVKDLQPLGIEADEAAALRLADDQVTIAPLVRRAFDGCDVTLTGDDAAVVTVQLRNSSATEAKEIQVALRELAVDDYRAPLDEAGGYLLVDRAPGDDLRVKLDRDHLVFDPQEKLSLSVEPHLKAEAAKSPINLEAILVAEGAGNVVWQNTQLYDPKSKDTLALELQAPDDEGAYLLRLALRRPTGFANKLKPWESVTPLATRDVNFVVINPKSPLPKLADEWDTVQTIDAAGSRSWPRLPQWTQVDRIPGLTSPRPLGNVKPATGGVLPAGFVELPTTRIGGEPGWQAYPLSIAQIDRPHAIEIELPHNARQHLGVSIVEPDAAGRVLSFGRDWGAYGDDRFAPPDGKALPDVHRVVFWPRTSNPVLLLSNRSPTATARYGKVRVLARRVDQAQASATDSTPDNFDPDSQAPTRLVAAYIGLPRLADCLGAAEQLDEEGKLSVDGWDAFLTAATRLAQELEASGYNAAIVCVAANGSSLAPIEALGASPRYDTGPLSGSAGDPLRKDVLEVLLRVFDREGLRLIPAVELATPLPRLETLRAATSKKSDDNAAGMECIYRDGRSWSQHFVAEAAVAPHYNVLHPDVQASIGDIVDQLAERYGHHKSLAGVALQLSGGGYGVLPGLAWGMDRGTVARFAAAEKVKLPENGNYKQTADLVLGPQINRWKNWRCDEMTKFYAGLAKRARRHRPDWRLVLCTEDIFSGPEAAQRLRQAAIGQATLADAAAEIGLDLHGLAASPGVALMRPRRLDSDDSLVECAAAVQINAAAELDDAVLDQPAAGELFYHTSTKLRLASFDAQSPYGSDKTFLSLASPSAPTGDAARRPLATALGRREFLLLAEGSELAPQTENAETIRARRIFQELPAADAEVRTERREPVVLRIYRQANATTLCLINESPWPVTLELPIEAPEPVPWRALGRAAATTDGDTAQAGQWPKGDQTWKVALPPYGIEARRFDTRAVRLGALTSKLDDVPAAVLAQRIGDIERRMNSLDVERPYNELHNPDFELTGADSRPVGWQPRVGRSGAVDVDAAQASSGSRSLRLTSQDNLGVAAQSQLFPIPATGQLVVRLLARAEGWGPGSQLYAWVEYDDGGAARRYWEPLAGAEKLGSNWATCEFAVNDLPTGEDGNMRVNFHLVGQGKAWIDNVRLFDLRFPSAQRVELGKWLYAAKTALDQRQLVECQRLVEGYWPRYLLEHVPPQLAPPPLSPEVSIAARPAESDPAQPVADESGKESQSPGLRGLKLFPFR